MQCPILVVDDNCNDIELLQAALELCGNELPVEVLGDGQQALDFLTRKGEFSSRTAKNPLFVLLDIKLPRVDGFELLKAMRDSAEFRSLPVVLFTSSRHPRDLTRAYEIGVNAFVQKPNSFTELKEVVAHILSVWGKLNEVPPAFRCTVSQERRAPIENSS